MVERRTPCTSTLLTVERIHPARPHYRWWKGIHSPKYRVLTVEGVKPCMSTLLHVHTAEGGQGYTLHVHTAEG
jgi:hypothetical protein